MAVFQWVGGYTAHTGFLSGYSGNYNGSGKAVWTSIFNGLTSVTGDCFFAPYYWSFTQNWRERIPATPNTNGWVYNYLPATRLPRGGDHIVFGSEYTNVQGTDFAELLSASISLLFGGLSGNQWPQSTQGQTSDISVEIHHLWGGRQRVADKFYNAENYYGGVGLGDYHKYWPTGTFPDIPRRYQFLHRGSIGFDSSQVSGHATWGSFPVIGQEAFNFSLTGDRGNGTFLVETDDYIDPIDLRFSSFRNSSVRAKVRVKQVSTTTNSAAWMVNAYQSTTADAPDPATPALNPTIGTTGNTSLLAICGRVGTIEQDNGTLRSIRYKGVGLSADGIYIHERPIGLYLDESTTIYQSIVAEPNMARSTLNIHCGSPYLYLAHKFLYGNPSSLFPPSPEGVTFAIGNRYGGLDGYSCTFGRVDTESVDGLTNSANEPTPRVFMYNTELTTFYGKGGYLKTAADPFTGFPVFRDGFLRRNTVVDLSRNADPTYRSGLIGLSPSDEGLRMDSLDARIVFAEGQNFIIDSKGDPLGLT